MTDSIWKDKIKRYIEDFKKNPFGTIVDALGFRTFIDEIQMYEKGNDVLRSEGFDQFLDIIVKFAPKIQVLKGEKHFDANNVHFFCELMKIFGKRGTINGRHTIITPAILEQELKRQGFGIDDLKEFHDIYHLPTFILDEKGDLKDPIEMPGIHVRNVEEFINDIYRELIGEEKKWFLYMFILSHSQTLPISSRTFNEVLVKVIQISVMISVMLDLESLRDPGKIIRESNIKIGLKGYEDELRKLAEEIMLRYSYLFDDSTRSSKPPECPDIESLFFCLEDVGLKRLTLDTYYLDMQKLVNNIPLIPQIRAKTKDTVFDKWKEEEKIRNKELNESRNRDELKEKAKNKVR
jgi:hypothetical protein